MSKTNRIMLNIVVAYIEIMSGTYVVAWSTSKAMLVTGILLLAAGLLRAFSVIFFDALFMWNSEQ